MAGRVGADLKGFMLLLFSYCALSFAFSFLAFLSPTPRPPHLLEYTLDTFIIEVGGHFFFALVAALPLLDFSLVLLTGFMGVAIDTDHILAMLGFQVSSQPSHSLLFALIATLFGVQVAKQIKSRGEASKVAFIIPLAILAHISYDVYAAFNQGAGPSFPFLLPFSFTTITLPYSTWPLLEVGAVGLASAGYLAYSKLKHDHSGQ